MRSGRAVLALLAMLGAAGLGQPTLAAPSSDALLQAAQAALGRDDEASAFSLLQRLVLADDPAGELLLGELFEQPKSGGRADPKAAGYWYQRAAENGNGEAARRLGDLFAKGQIGTIQERGRFSPWLGEAVRWYQAAAKAGDAEASQALGALAATSPLAKALAERAAGDAAAARADLTTLAGHGGLEARYWLGVMLERGEGGAADPAGAVRWYVSAANEGEPHAALALGRIYLEGAPPNLDRAYEFFSRAQARGMPGEAGVGLGMLDLARRGKKLPSGVAGALAAYAANEPALAAGLLFPLAHNGDADAQYWLGTLMAANAVPVNRTRPTSWGRDEAMRWFHAAAAQGDIEAAYQLAQLLAPNRGMDISGHSLGDAAEQVRWLKLAAEGGQHEAAQQLAEAYREGQGVAPNPAVADAWLKRAQAMEGAVGRLSRPACVEDDNAPELLPVFLACNRGDSEGLAAALLPLAEGGNARAEAWVGYLMASGAGGSSFNPALRPNAQRAARWYAKAADQHLPSAMFDLGVLLEHGLGVPLDQAKAKSWYLKAADAGFPGAKEAAAAVGTAQP